MIKLNRLWKKTVMYMMSLMLVFWNISLAVPSFFGEIAQAAPGNYLSIDVTSPAYPGTFITNNTLNPIITGGVTSPDAVITADLAGFSCLAPLNAPANDSWTLDAAACKTDGLTPGVTYPLTLSATSVADGPDSLTGSFLIDVVSPVIAQVTPVPTPTADNTPAYRFSTDEWVGSVSYTGDCNSGDTGAFYPTNVDITFNTLADGLHNNCTITAVDAAGNTSNTLNVSPFTVDTLAPTVSAMTFAGRTGTVTGGDTVNLDLSGVTDVDLATAGNINVSEDSSLQITSPPTGGPIALTSGNNSLTTASLFGYSILASELRDTAVLYGGLIPVSGVLTDGLGNTTNVTINISVDITPPTTGYSVTGGTVGDNGWYRGATAPIITLSTELSATIHWQWESEGWHSGATDQTPPVTVGTRTLEYYSVDLYTNEETPHLSRTVMYDNTQPTTTGGITGGTVGDDNWYVSDVIFTLTPADTISGVASTVYCVDTADTCTPTTPYVSAITVATESATNYVRWFSTDSAGNIQDTQSSGAIKIDKTNPTGVINSPANGDHVRQTVVISASMSDLGSDVQRIEYWMDSGAELIGATITPASSDTMSWDTTTTTDGAHDLSVVVYDNAGNYTISALVSVVVDNTDPTGGVLTWATFNHPGANTITPVGKLYTLTPPLAGEDTFTALSLVVNDVNLDTANVPVYIDHSIVPNGYMAYSVGTWYYVPGTPVVFAEGSHHISANFTDTAGNSVYLTVRFRTDWTAPSGGDLTWATVNHPGGTVVSPIGNTYSIMPALTGDDTFNTLDIVVNDNNLILNDVPVYIDGSLTESGHMTYSGGGVWTYEPYILTTFSNGIHNLSATFTDRTGYETTLIIRFMIDAIAPVVAVTGSSDISIEYGNTYTDAGATASDNLDGDLTSQIITTGSVNTMALGNYTINYTVSDDAGNTTTASRLVHVIPRNIIVAADAKTKVSGTSDPALTYHIVYGALVGSDSFSGSLTRTTREAAGMYQINQGTLALSGNYNLAFTGAVFTITAAPVGSTSTYYYYDTLAPDETPTDTEPEVLGTKTTASIQKSGNDTEVEYALDTDSDPGFLGSTWLGMYNWAWLLLAAIIVGGGAWWIISARRQNQDIW